MSEAAKSAPENSKKAVAVEAAKKNNRNSLLRCLIRARDIYVNTFCGCAGAGGGSRRGGGGGFTAGVAVLMPRARSRSAFGQSSGLGEDDFIDLVRASSKRNAAAAVVAVVPRSQSSAPAIGRIDEERSTEFEGDVRPGIGARSQSCTVVAGGKMLRGRV